MSIQIDIGALTSSWSNCDRISTYVARIVSHNRADSLLYSNLFSSALNELMETVFRTQHSSGELDCRVWRAGPVDRIELLIPCDEEARRFYQGAVDAVARTDAADHYMQALFAEGALDPRIGLFELVIDYKARLFVEAGDGATVRLVAELALEDADPHGTGPI